MIRLLTVLLLLVGTLPAFSQTGELDNEARVINAEQTRLAADLPGTLVIRIHKDTNQAEVFHSTDQLPAELNSHVSLANVDFRALDVQGSMSGELDRDSSSSSWYFYFYNYSYAYPTYYYAGYTYPYTPYYNYYWGPYHYYYYGWY